MIKMDEGDLKLIQADKYLVSPEARLVLFIAQWIVYQRRPAKIERILAQTPVAWEDFNLLLAQHELSSFAYSFFRPDASLLPETQTDKMKKSHYFALFRMAELEKEFLGVLDMFAARGIDLLPLKGTAFLLDNLYGSLTGLRPMVDIDIMVKKEQISQAEESAELLGYRKELGGLKENYWRKNNYHIIYAKNKNQQTFATLELHWLLDYPGKTLLLPLLWERASKITVHKREISILSPEDTLFCLVLHLRRFGNVFSLKSACDFARLLVRNKDLDWDYIIRQAKAGKICASLYFRLVQAGILFGLWPPDSILKSLKVHRCRGWLIRKSILCNSFLSAGQYSNTVFLKHHFLVYDNFWKPLSMIINIPPEQFAKFYRLQPYSVRARWLYRLRVIFLPLALGKMILKAFIRKTISLIGGAHMTI